MYQIVTGGMRSGKSYYLTKLALDAIEQGRVVCTDIPLNIEDCPHLYRWEWSALTDVFTTEQLSNGERFHRYPYLALGGVLYLLDEGWKGLKSGDRTIANNIQLMSFFREHGQFINEDGLANDIVLCTQNFKSLNSQLRELADKTVLCVKPTGIGVKNMTINYHIDGAWAGLRPPRGSNKDLILKTVRVFLNPEVYKCYNSHAKTTAKDGINKGGFDKEGTVSTGQTVFHSWSFRLSMLFSIIAIWVVSHNVLAFVNSQYKQPINQSIEATNDKSIKDVKNTADSVHDSDTSSSNDWDRTKGVDKLPDVSSGVSNSVVSTPNVLVGQQLPKNSKVIILSTDWRLASVIRNKRTKEWLIYIVDAKNHLTRIDPTLCTHDEFGQIECVMNNERITSTSGQKTETVATIPVPSIFTSSK